MRVAFGSDDRTAVTESIIARLVDLGHEVVECGHGDDWPDVGHRVGRAVADERADRGVVCCWTGTGVSIAANKIPGARAALCTDSYSAAGARKWNDANVLAIGLRLTTAAVADEMVDAFLTTDAEAAQADNVAKLEL